MKIKKHVLLAIIGIYLIFYTTSAGTMAWFTDSTSSEVNVFKTGTLKIGTKTSDGIVSETFAAMTFDNLIPGDSGLERITTITNIGSLPLKLYKITTDKLESIDGSEFANIDEKLNVELFLNETKVYEGNMSQLRGKEGDSFDQIFLVDVNQDVTMKVKVAMDKDAGDEYQGKGIKCNFILWAEQTEVPLTEEIKYDLQLATINLGKNNTSEYSFTVTGKNDEDCIKFLFSLSEDCLLLRSNIYYIKIKNNIEDPNSKTHNFKFNLKLKFEDRIRLYNSGEDTDKIDINGVTIDYAKNIIKISKSALPQNWEGFAVSFGSRDVTPKQNDVYSPYQYIPINKK